MGLLLSHSPKEPSAQNVPYSFPCRLVRHLTCIDIDAHDLYIPRLGIARTIFNSAPFGVRQVMMIRFPSITKSILDEGQLSERLEPY